MARKSKRRPIRRAPQDRTEQLIAQQRRLDVAAHGLLNGRSVEQLRSELHDRELLLAEADQAAQVNPGPGTLANYRLARSQVEAAQRALELMTGSRPGP
jgi:hypothetical protein